MHLLQAARQVWDTVGQVVTTFEPQECTNYFESCENDPE